MTDAIKENVLDSIQHMLKSIFGIYFLVVVLY